MSFSSAARAGARRLTSRRSSSATCAPACRKASSRPRSPGRSARRWPRSSGASCSSATWTKSRRWRRRDALAAAQFRLFHPILPMLATPQETAETRAGDHGRAGRFYAEDKLDGIRAQVHKSGDGPAARVAIYTRDLAGRTPSFPDVVAAVSSCPATSCSTAKSSPSATARSSPSPTSRSGWVGRCLTPEMLEDNPCTFIAFDLLYRDGRLLMDCPLRERQAALARVAASAAGSAPPLSARSRRRRSRRRSRSCRRSTPRASRRNEGIVLKDPDSPYAPGRRGQMWLKLKTHLPTFDCVVTAAEYRPRQAAELAERLHVRRLGPRAGRRGSTLVNIGKAYSGVTDEEIDQLTEICS